jgi:hypothetical protein
MTIMDKFFPCPSFSATVQWKGEMFVLQKGGSTMSRKTQKWVVYLMLISMLITTILAGISMWF